MIRREEGGAVESGGDRGVKARRVEDRGTVEIYFFSQVEHIKGCSYLVQPLAFEMFRNLDLGSRPASCGLVCEPIMQMLNFMCSYLKITPRMIKWLSVCDANHEKTIANGHDTVAASRSERICCLDFALI